MSLTPAIFVRSPRTEAAQAPQCMFGTLRLTSVMPSPSPGTESGTTVSGVCWTVSVLDGVLVVVSDGPEQPITAKSATCQTIDDRFMGKVSNWKKTLTGIVYRPVQPQPSPKKKYSQKRPKYRFWQGSLTNSLLLRPKQYGVHVASYHESAK